MSTEKIREEISNIKKVIVEYQSMDLSTQHLEENLRYLEELLNKELLKETEVEKGVKGDAHFCCEEMGIENWTDPTMDHIYIKLTAETAKQLYRAIGVIASVAQFLTIPGGSLK